jgi:hypothetical protein
VCERERERGGGEENKSGGVWCFCLMLQLFDNNERLKIANNQRCKVNSNKVLRRIFGPMRDEVTGEWRRLHNEKLNDLYSSLLFR